MLQRIQTIWLLLVAALAFASLKLSFFSGNTLIENVKQFQGFTAMSNMLIMILTVGVGIASVVAIFLFRNRQLQIRICFGVLAVVLLNILLYYLQTKNFVPNEWSFDLTSLVTIAIPFLLFLAIRAIYKDEQLVKSVDRLR